MLNKHEPSFEEPVAGNPHGGFCEELAPSIKKERVYSMYFKHRFIQSGLWRHLVPFYPRVNFSSKGNFVNPKLKITR